ncbi:MAG: hypothetical protein M1825_001843 [Sarcosagium campestre]|nr:MAG: hypothetical protein M1825_001843 [Sarcosagium campestre]
MRSQMEKPPRYEEPGSQPKQDVARDETQLRRAEIVVPRMPNAAAATTAEAEFDELRLAAIKWNIAARLKNENVTLGMTPIAPLRSVNSQPNVPLVGVGSAFAENLSSILKSVGLADEGPIKVRQNRLRRYLGLVNFLEPVI